MVVEQEDEAESVQLQMYPERPNTSNKQYTKPSTLRPARPVTHHGPIPHSSSVLAPTFLLFCRDGPDRGIKLLSEA